MEEGFGNLGDDNLKWMFAEIGLGHVECTYLLVEKLQCRVLVCLIMGILALQKVRNFSPVWLLSVFPGGLFVVFCNFLFTVYGKTRLQRSAKMQMYEGYMFHQFLDINVWYKFSRDEIDISFFSKFQFD
jgi:hypothetical protein